MRVAVTGAAGFIGRHLVWALDGRGDSVLAVLRPGAIPPPGWSARVEVAFADLANPLPEGALGGDVDTLFHCAARVRPAWDRKRYLRDNVLATRNVLDACALAGVRRVVHLSSAAVHGEDVDHHGADETSPFAHPPPNAYVATKILAEAAVDEARVRGLDVVILRPGWVWGPHDASVLGMARALRRGRFALPGQGRNLLHLAYVENVAQAARAAAESAGRNETFLIHDGGSVTSGEFVRRLAGSIGCPTGFRHVPIPLALEAAGALEAGSRLLRRDPAITRYQVAILARNQGFSIGKVRRLLSFEPAVSFTEGLARTARWILEADRPRGPPGGTPPPRRAPRGGAGGT